MALPRRRHSQGRRDRRRAHWKPTVSGVMRCPQCAKPIRSHHVCSSCGFYRGRSVVTIPAKEDRAKS